MSGPVSRFFKAVHDSVTEIPNWTFEIGVYGTRNVCESIISKGFASTAFIAGMSWGWSGNMGFPMPKKWSYNQIAGSTLTSGSKVIDIDKVVVSSKATSASLSDVTVPPTTQKGEAPTATGFDMLFEWVVRAELASERAGIAQPQLAEVVLGFLRKPTYWSEDLKTSLLWQAYTPEALIPQRAGAEQLMSAIDTTKDVRKEAETGSASYHDYPHLAASTLGYLCHPEQGSVPVGNVFSLGDLGAWELDLITLWRDYLNSGVADLRTYMRRKFAALPAGDSSMSFADTIADADAYLIASELLRDRSRRLSTVLRTLYKQHSVDRFAAFYAMRFQGSKDVFSEVLRRYTSPEYYQVLESIFGTVIDFAFNIPRRPTESELSVIADVVYESAHGGLSVY